MGVITYDLDKINWARWRTTRYVECVDGPASPEIEIRDDGSRAVRTFFIPWVDWPQASFELIGGPSIATGASGVKYISRETPHFFPLKSPEDGNRHWLYATTIQRIEGIGTPKPGASGVVNLRDSDDIAVYLLAKMTILYESLTYLVAEDNEILVAGVPNESTLKRYVTFNANPAAEYLPLPTGTAFYSGFTPAVGVQIQPNRIYPNYDWMLTWHRVPEAAIGCRLINPSAATTPQDDCLGKVNNASFPPGATNPIRPGQLLLNGITFRRVRGAHGQRLWDVEYRFKYFNPGEVDVSGNPAGNNHLLRVNRTVTPPTVKFEEVTFDGVVAYPYDGSVPGTKPLYTGADFGKLFRPA